MNFIKVTRSDLSFTFLALFMAFVIDKPYHLIWCRFLSIEVITTEVKKKK